MKYRYVVAEPFWKIFYNLLPSQKESTRETWKIFKENPFDPRLRTHKIHSLSSKLKRTIYAVEIEKNLRAIFYVEGDLVVTLDIGTHDVYKGQ